MSLTSAGTPSPPPRARSVAAACLAFAIGLTVTTCGLRQLALRSASPSGGALEHLVKRGRAYDVVVIGPSFVQMHFLPPVFDERMKALGHPVRSFGFGMSGLRGGELDYYLERIAALRLPRLRHVLIDVTLDQRRPLEKANAFKRRVIYWHDPRQLSFMRRVIDARTDDPAKRAGYLWRHAQHALLKAANVGEGVEGLRQGVLLGDRLRVRERRQLHLNAARGEKQLKLAAKFLARNGKRFAKDAGALRKQRKQRRRHPRDNELVRVWRDELRAAGLDAAFVISPVLRYSALARAVPGDEPLRVLDFNDPDRYPQLYDASLHYDRSHFHYQGALLFSRTLAEAFAAELDARGAPGGR